MSDFVPWTNRQSEPEPRIHDDELTEEAANRIGYLIGDVITDGELERSFKRYQQVTGESLPNVKTTTEKQAVSSFHQFLVDREFDAALTILELTLNELWKEPEIAYEKHEPSNLGKLHEDLRQTLVETGMLLRLQPNQDEVDAYVNKLQRYKSLSGGTLGALNTERPDVPFNIQFERIADESVIEADQDLRVLAKEDRWTDALSPYDTAWSVYKNEESTFKIAEKLYDALENVLVKITVEEQDWNDEGDGVSAYLESMKDNGLFDPNKAMFAEWEQIINGIQIGVQRTGGDRKRHGGEFDQDYALLLLHQTSAFLTFIISRYEDEYPPDDSGWT
jgi:hypothetical protein